MPQRRNVPHESTPLGCGARAPRPLPPGRCAGALSAVPIASVCLESEKGQYPPAPHFPPAWSNYHPFERLLEAPNMLVRTPDTIQTCYFTVRICSTRGAEG